MTIHTVFNYLQNVVNRINTKDYRVIVEDVDHIHNIKKAERDTNNKIAEGVCPKCGENS